MTILATRFKTLDLETNLPTADFLTASGSDILNAERLGISELSADMTNFFSKGVQVPKLELPSATDNLVRNVKGAFGSLKDLSKLSSKQIDGAIADMLPDNPLAQSAFNLMSSKCKTKGMGKFNMGKPYDPSIDCGGRKKKAGSKTGGCSTNQFGNVLNKLTKGAYNAKFNDLNSMLKNLVNLASFGYDMNMCGVFTALTSGGGFDKNMLSRASGSLLGGLAATKNILGVFDLAGASAGLHTLKENPGGIKSVFKTLEIPKEIKQPQLASFSDRLTGSMEMFDSKWDKSKFDGIMSSASIPKYNDALTQTFKGKMMSERISVADLSIPKSSSAAMHAMANKASKFGSRALSRLA